MSYKSEILKRIGNRSLTKDVDETIYFGFPQYVLPNPWEELSEKDARKSNYFLELVNYSGEGVECWRLAMVDIFHPGDNRRV